MKKIQKQLTVDRWIADDGTEFIDQNECAYYEWKSKAKKVFIIERVDGPAGYKDYDNIELFSTQEKAEKAMTMYNQDHIWDIFEIYLDIRLWNKEK